MGIWYKPIAKKIKKKCIKIYLFNSIKAIPIKCFVSHCPTDPFFWKSKKKVQNHLWRSKFFSLQAHDLVLLTPVVLNYHRYFVFCSLFRHLVGKSCSCYTIWLWTKGPRNPFVLSSPAFTGTQNPSCVHSFFFAWPTDPPSREGGRWKTKHFIGMA